MTESLRQILHDFLALSDAERLGFIEHLLRAEGSDASWRLTVEMSQEWCREIERLLAVERRGPMVER